MRLPFHPLRSPIRVGLAEFLGILLVLPGCAAPLITTDCVESCPPAAMNSSTEMIDGSFVGHSEFAVCDAPRELNKVSLPRYTVEPPDILLVESTHNLRRHDAPLRAADQLMIRVANTLPIDPRDGDIVQGFKQIDGVFVVLTDGTIDFGPEYGKVRVDGLSVDEARQEIERHLRINNSLAQPQLIVTLMQPDGKQLISGEHLVRPDGMLSLGVYGEVYVAGMTLPEVKMQVERHLSRYLHHPEVSVDVLAYNSKFYYVVTDGGGAGERVHRFVCTGNETVLDAISQINGLPIVSSKKDIWIARPSPAGGGFDQVLPVEWDAIVRGGQTDTNYQLLPGDRIYVKADDLVKFDTFVAKITSPIERVLGFTLLGNGAYRSVQFGHRFGGTGVGGGGF